MGTTVLTEQGRIAAVEQKEIAGRNELVESALEAVRNVAFMVARRYPAADVEDLIQLGAVGAIQAARTYEADRGIPFPAFAYRRIRGAMLDSLRRRKAIDETNHIHIDEYEYDTYGGRDVGLPVTTIDVEAIHGAIDDQRRMAQVRRTLRSRRLNRDQRTVIRAILRGKSLREAAEKVGLTPPRAAQIRSAALEIIRHQMIPEKIAA